MEAWVEFIKAMVRPFVIGYFGEMAVFRFRGSPGSGDVKGAL